MLCVESKVFCFIFEIGSYHYVVFIGIGLFDVFGDVLFGGYMFYVGIEGWLSVVEVY